MLNLLWKFVDLQVLYFPLLSLRFLGILYWMQTDECLYFSEDEFTQNKFIVITVLKYFQALTKLSHFGLTLSQSSKLRLEDEACSSSKILS
jgi:hypothetical protein